MPTFNHNIYGEVDVLKPDKKIMKSLRKKDDILTLNSDVLLGIPINIIEHNCQKGYWILPLKINSYNSRYIWTYKLLIHKAFYKVNEIFIHIPKTGGLSICNYDKKHIWNYGHIYAIYFPKYVRKIMKTIVRNPYDRLVSGYFWMKKGGFYKNEIYKEITDKYDFEKYVLEYLTEERVNTYDHQLEILTPQYKFICSETGRLLIKKENIGHFENYKDDVKRLFDMDIDYKNNESNHDDWRTYYNNIDVKNKVQKLYAKDFEIFGYSVDL